MAQARCGSCNGMVQVAELVPNPAGGALMLAGFVILIVGACL